MAHFERFGSYVILVLSPKEKFFGFHSSPQAKLSEVISIRKVEKMWTWKTMKGIRACGTGIHWVIALGTWRYRRGKNFLAVYGRRPGYIVTFNSGAFKQWVVTPDNTEDEIQKIFPGVITAG